MVLRQECSGPLDHSPESWRIDPWLKIFIFLALETFCTVDLNGLPSFGRGHCEENFCNIILNLNQSFRRRCSLKIFLSIELEALLFGRAEPFHLCNFARGHFKEHIYDFF